MSTKANRNKIRQWFITYPQWAPNHKEEILNFFLEKYTLIYYKIAQETHEDGNPHYHIVIKLDEGITKKSLLSLIETTYPNDYKKIDVKSVRSIAASIKYLDKEDTKCLEHPDGYTETRQPLQHFYQNTLRSWANFMGFDTIEEYSKYIQVKIENNSKT